MIVEFLAFLFFATTVTFVILYFMRKQALGNEVKDDLATLLTQPGIIHSKPGTVADLSPKEADCIANKYASEADYDPAKLGLILGGLCGMFNFKFPVCQKYIKGMDTLDVQKIAKECM